MKLRAPEASFLGSHTNKIDQKGRVAAPADFRRALEGDPLHGFYCLPSPRGRFLECGGGDMIAFFKELIGELPPFDEDRELLETHLLGAVRPLSFDTEGRVVIPEPLRSHAALSERVLFQGRGETFWILPADAAPAPSNAERDRLRAALQRLGAKNSGGAS